MPAPPIASLTAALLSSMKEPPTGDAGWAQLLPPETWAGPWEGFGTGHSESLCSSSSDPNCVDSASVMSVAWRACPFCLSANTQIWSLEGEETHPRANQPGRGATVAKAISKGKSEGAGETPPLLTHTKAFLPRPLAMPEIPLR